jgi:hypothetical protein
MARYANFSFVQVRPGVFCVRATSPEFRPGPSGPETFVVRVTNIPDGATAETMGKQLAKLLDPFDLPVLVEWSELARAD